MRYTACLLDIDSNLEPLQTNPSALITVRAYENFNEV